MSIYKLQFLYFPVFGMHLHVCQKSMILNQVVFSERSDYRIRIQVNYVSGEYVQAHNHFRRAEFFTLADFPDGYALRPLELESIALI